MKRVLCVILCACFLFSGCGFFGERIREPVTFYYICEKYQDELCCVIVSEQREASGHSGDLSYLLALYSMGPTSDGMVSPLPPGTQISPTIEENHIELELITYGNSMSEIEFSLACACLTLTSLEISGAEEVTVYCGDRIRTMNRSALTLQDAIAETTSTEESK